MQDLESCINFEPQKDTNELEKIIERYKSYFGVDPLEEKYEEERRTNQVSNVS